MKSEKYIIDWEDLDGMSPEETAQKILNLILEDPNLLANEEIIIGQYTPGYDAELTIELIIKGLIKNKDKLSHIKSFYFADMDSEECEVSWINQGDYSEFWGAFPQLEKVTIKGADGLKLGANINYGTLKHLELINGGLDVSVLNDLKTSSFPALETLIIYLGDENYGATATPDDVQSLITHQRFPKLKNLQLVNSEFENEIIGIVAHSDLLPQLETISFSYGVLDNVGGQSLIDHAEKFQHLTNIKIEWCYINPDMEGKIKTALPNVTVEISDMMDADDWKSVMLSE